MQLIDFSCSKLLGTLRLDPTIAELSSLNFHNSMNTNENSR